MAHPSKVPEHLRPFFRSNLTTEPQAQYSYTSPTSISSAQGVELCPPHWRLAPKRTLRDTLTDILLKDWQGTHRHTSSQSRIKEHTSRSSVMRMKDSDDYITARAANPRTGLISPSIGSRTPRLCTPNTPGEALQLSAPEEQPPSPTPELKIRPPLRRANEGRRLSAESAFIWRADGTGWTTGAGVAIASPRVAHIKADASLITSKSQPAPGDDQFIIRMPSGHEPQPYAYPGYSSKQIKAFEHYKDKARRVSGEGYDQRLLHAARQTSTSAKPSVSEESIISIDGSQRRFRDDIKGITVPKKGGRTSENDDNFQDSRCCSEHGVRMVSFAPFSSPKTPIVTATGDSSTAMKTLPEGAGHCVRRKVVGGAAVLESDMSPGYADCTRALESPDFPGVADLRCLPRVTLVHPSSAGIPHSHSLRQKGDSDSDGAQKCSLGCYKNPDRNICMERRAASNSAALPVTRSLFDHQRKPSGTGDAQSQVSGTNESRASQQLAPQLSEIFITAFVGAVDACRNVQLPSLPRIGIFAVLYAEDTTPQQKVSALKTMLSSAGQAVLFLTIIAMIWQVGSLVVRVLEMLLWPFMVPLKILRWLAGVS